MANSASNLSSTSLSTDQVTNFEVKVLILPESYQHLLKADKPDYFPFRPGMSATVDILTNSIPNALSIPIQSVTTRSDTVAKVEKNVPKGGPGQPEADETDEKLKKASETNVIQEIVFVLKDGKCLKRKVKTGIQDSNYIQILEGLNEKDEVIVAPYSAISRKLEDNKLVKKVKKEELYSEK